MRTEAMERSQFWTIGLGWCVVIALATTFSLAMLSPPSFQFLLTNLATSLIYALSIGLPTTAVMSLLLSKDKPDWQRTLIGLVVPALLTVPSSLVGMGILVCVGLVPLDQLWIRWQFDARIALLISIAVSIPTTLYARLRARLERTQLELKSKELARERAEKLASEAQFASLASRLEPHFLFNTLNSISSLIRTDPPRAERILGRFAALLRSSLDAREGDLVSLRNELQLVRNYLEIQQARYAHRLRYELDVPDSLLQQRVPPFSIQTLVENSVKYAVAPSPSGSMIRVVATLHGAGLCLEVWDEGPGFSVEQVRRNHGIDNLRERLSSIFGQAARVTIGRERFAGRGPELTRVAVELPIRSEVAA